MSVLIFFLFAFLGRSALAKGEWQVSLHYGLWSLIPVESIIENLIGDELESEFKRLIGEYSEIIDQDGSYSHNIDFDSEGKNLALEIRFYPAGQDGSFSIGLAVEKSELEIFLEGLVKYELTDGTYVQGSGNGKLLLKPTSYHLSFRWDAKPSQRLHSYIGFGAGLGSLKGNLFYEVKGEFYNVSTAEFISQTYSDQINLDFLEYTDQKITPLIFQLNLGLNFKIIDHLHILLDGGIWDGFLVRGGLSLRV